jgi:hypothetical protein
LPHPGDALHLRRGREDDHVKPWEIQRKRAEKRRREEARRERKKGPRSEPGRFRLIKIDGATGAETEVIIAAVIVKNPDESVFEAGFDELEPGMVLVLEDDKGLIQKAVVEEKTLSAGEEELPILKVRLS